jgi:hypothetical protein
MCLSLPPLDRRTCTVPLSGLKSATVSLVNSEYLAPVSNADRTSRRKSGAAALSNRLASTKVKYLARVASVDANGSTRAHAALLAILPSRQQRLSARAVCGTRGEGRARSGDNEVSLLP